MSEGYCPTCGAPGNKDCGNLPSVEELIERSSLGTPEAKALRASAPAEAVAKVMERVRELEANDGPSLPWRVVETYGSFGPLYHVMDANDECVAARVSKEDGLTIVRAVNANG